MDGGTKRPCPCQICKGRNILAWQTIRKHLETNGSVYEEESSSTDFLQSLHHHGRDEPLFDGASTTLLQAVIILLGLFSSFPGVSQTFMSALLRALADYIIPQPNILPRSFKEAKAVISPLLTPIEKVQMCRNKCILYTDDNENLDSCPKCQAPRSPKFVYSYIPIIPRLRRWMSVPEIAKALQTHLSPVRSSSEPMTDIQQSPVWEGFMERMGDTRSIGFALNTDGVDPFNHLNVQYSMWPVMLSIYNLPPEIREQFCWITLHSIIPGPTTPPEMNHFLRLLMNELLKLRHGVVMYDAHRKEDFVMQGELLNTTTDVPGGNKVYKTACVGSLNHACWVCEQLGKRIAEYNRVLYLENHRFLPDNCPLRTLMAGEGGGTGGPPRLKTREEVYESGRAVQQLQEEVDNRRATKASLGRLQKSTGKKGIEELARLPYFDPIYGRPVEVMHCVQVVAKKVLGHINGHVNGAKTLQAEQALGRFTRSEPEEPETVVRGGKRKAGSQGGAQKRVDASHPAWALDKEGLQTADRRCLQIQVPHGYEWRPKPFFSKLPYMKSHEWMEVVTDGVLKYAVRGQLGKKQQDSLFELLDCLAVICSPEISADEIASLELKVDKAVATMQIHWPLCLHTIMMHLLHHISMYLREYGPAPGTWMFGFERFNNFISKRIMKRDTPEANVMETYRIFELTQFLTWIGKVPAGAVPTDAVAQLRAVTAARRDLDSQPMETRSSSALEEQDEDIPPATEGPQDEVTEEGEDPSRPQPTFAKGLGLLSSRLKKPVEVQLSDREVALIGMVTKTNPASVNRQATRHFSATLKRPRKQVMSCALVDKTSSHVCSSYISVLADDGEGQNCIDRSGKRLYIYFGRIQYYVSVTTRSGTQTELAMVRWFPMPDRKDGLWVVKPSEQGRPIPFSFLPCSLLPPPLLVAHDDGDLFFLNANIAALPIVRLPL